MIRACSAGCGGAGTRRRAWLRGGRASGAGAGLSAVRRRCRLGLRVSKSDAFTSAVRKVFGRSVSVQKIEALRAELIRAGIVAGARARNQKPRRTLRTWRANRLTKWRIHLRAMRNGTQGNSGSLKAQRSSETFAVICLRESDHSGRNHGGTGWLRRFHPQVSGPSLMAKPKSSRLRSLLQMGQARNFG
jgi:hypothetical protein